MTPRGNTFTPNVVEATYVYLEAENSTLKDIIGFSKDFTGLIYCTEIL